jgi:hypothetical protein
MCSMQPPPLFPTVIHGSDATLCTPLLQRCGNNSSYQSTSHSRSLENLQPSSNFAQAWLRRAEEPEYFQIERRVIIIMPILCCLQLHHTVH